MYTLYFVPGACSLATQSILHELNQPVTLKHKQDAEDYSQLNPAGTVPVLIDGDRILNEGVAILLYLLNKHENMLLPTSEPARQRAIERMLLANASMHPAYGRLFFIASNVVNEEGRQQAFDAAAEAINGLWRAVETRFPKDSTQEGPFLGGSQVSPADFLLTVYSRWGQFFPVDIRIGPRASAMIEAVMARESFQLALQRESEYQHHAA
ncbi:MAG: glutathione S-transferase family protein [Ketobacter sp.]|nr:MAG: glutathione S-transferase family protein [Ketobacter sp.]